MGEVSGILIRAMTEPEKLYCYTQSQQIRTATGNVGYLRADMDSSGKGFFSTWTEFREDLNSPEFREDLERVVNALRTGDGPEAFLRDRSALGKFCYSHLETGLDDRQFGVRADTEEYAYLMRLNPSRGEYNLYCYCYLRSWLDRHLKEAERGIRFIDTGYNDLFRIPDGGRVRITWPDGERAVKVCRYVDPYHMELGSGGLSLFHICDFAARMQSEGAAVEPALPAVPERGREAAR